MKSFLVIWAITIDDTDSPREAAKKAHAMRENPGTIANVYDVYDQDTLKGIVSVDLNESPNNSKDVPDPIYLMPKIKNKTTNAKKRLRTNSR